MQRTYGPNHDALESFIEELSRLPWFTMVGQPTDQDPSLIRVALDDIVNLDPHPYQLWGNLLVEHEAPIDRLILQSQRLAADDALQRAVHITGDAVDNFFTSLTEKHPGYYRDTNSYLYELVDPPQRLILYKARELLVSDLAPELHFFDNFMPWFRRGHWPLGWRGSWPIGKLILW